jgi:UDP-N-acetylglucosamine---dolichyl-phosphate N-acetylglucosaminyltransferase
MQKIMAVIPARNEAKRISRVIEGVKPFSENIIVVDDCSSDNTFSVSKGIGADVIRLKDNMGVGFATRIGCDFALSKGAEVIITIDADGQHNPNDIPALLEPVLQGQADIVFGVRPRDKRMPLGKRIGNALLSLFIRILFKSDIKDALTGFHVFRSCCYRQLRWHSLDYGVASEIAYRTIKNKLKYKQVYVDTIYNCKKTGMKKRDGVKSIFLMIKWKMQRY